MPKKFFAKSTLLKKVLLAVIFLLLVVFAFRTLQSHMFNFHFVDEDENIVAGYYMAQGKKLYADIFSHKQPMPAVFGTLISKTFQPNSLFLFVKRHREAVFFYSVLWWLAFSYIFGAAGLAFSMVIEMIKRFLLGDLFLGESLVVYPLAFVIAYLWKKEFAKSTLSRWGRSLFLFSLILICFQLIILIPFVFIVIGYLFLKEKDKKRLGIELAFLFLVLVLVFLPFVDYKEYFLNTRAALASHYLEDTVNQGLSQLFTYSFLKPFAALITPARGEFGLFIRILSGTYLLSLVYLLFKEKKKKLFLLFTFFLLGTTSLRLVYPQAVLYEGFHGFPWLATIIMLTTIQIKRGVLLNWQPARRRMAVFGGLILVVLIFVFTGQFFFREYFRQPNFYEDFLVHFSPFEGKGMVIKALSAKDDKLMVIPVEQLLYFTSGLLPQNRFLYTYEWIFWNDGLKNEIKKDLGDNPPAFVYYDYASVGNDAKSIFDPALADYIQLRQGSDPSLILMRKDKLDILQPEQIEGIKKFGFSLPEIE